MFCDFSCLTFYYLLSGSGYSEVIKLNESLTIQPRFLQHIGPCLVLFIQSVIEAIIGCEAHIVRKHVGGGKQQSQVEEGQRYCSAYFMKYLNFRALRPFILALAEGLLALLIQKGTVCFCWGGS